MFSACSATVMQQRGPPELLARTTAFGLTGSYLLGSIGYAVIGRLAQVTGPGRMLGFSAAYAAASSTAVLACRSSALSAGRSAGQAAVDALPY